MNRKKLSERLQDIVKKESLIKSPKIISGVKVATKKIANTIRIENFNE